MKRLHLVRPEPATPPVLAPGDAVVYIEPTGEGLCGQIPDQDTKIGPDELLERIFQHHAVIVW